MRTRLMLDTNILVRICQPSKHADIQSWFRSILDQDPPGFELLVSPIAFYELQRSFLKVGAHKSIERLKGLAQHLLFVPVAVEDAERAAELWSRLLADDAARGRISDADLLIGAQAMREGAVLVTSDRPLAEFGARVGLDVRDWSDIQPGTK